MKPNVWIYYFDLDLFSVEEIISLYEIAAKQNKDNEEILSHLFMSYVRVCNFSKQQQVCDFGFCVQWSAQNWSFWKEFIVKMKWANS